MELLSLDLVPVSRPLQLYFLCSFDGFLLVRYERSCLLLSHRFVGVQRLCGFVPFVHFIEHDAFTALAHTVQRRLMASAALTAVNTLAAVVLKEQLASECVRESVCVLRAGLGTDAPAIRLNHVLRAYKGCVERYSKQLLRRECERTRIQELDHDVAINAELARQLQLYYTFVPVVESDLLRVILIRVNLTHFDAIHLVDFIEWLVAAAREARVRHWHIYNAYVTQVFNLR